MTVFEHGDWIATLVVICTAFLALETWRRWPQRRREYVLLPAHQCTEDEKRAAVQLISTEFGMAAGADAMAIFKRSGKDGLPVVFLALYLPLRTVVGHACWESARLKSAKPGGVAATTHVTKLAHTAGADEATVRRRGLLFGLTTAQLDTILADVKLAGGCTNRRIPKKQPSDEKSIENGGTVTLSRLVVHPSHRSRGIGGALTAAGTARCAELGADAIKGIARTASLIAYYKKLGATTVSFAESGMPSSSWGRRLLKVDLRDRGSLDGTYRTLSSNPNITIYQEN